MILKNTISHWMTYLDSTVWILKSMNLLEKRLEMTKVFYISFLKPNRYNSIASDYFDLFFTILFAEACSSNWLKSCWSSM